MADESTFARYNQDPAYAKLANIYSVCKQKKRDRAEEIYNPLKNNKTIDRVYEDLLESNTTNYTRIFQRILQSDGDIDYQIPADSPVKYHSSDLLAYSALHFAVDSCNESILASLLDLGARVTLRNANGFTPLRLAIERSYAKDTSCLNLMGTMVHPLASAILDAQLAARDSSNPRCNDGISHFHIACMLDHAKAVEFFLQNGVSPGEAVSSSSKRLPGYTGLHFAARYSSVRTIEHLMIHGSSADRQARDAADMTPLQIAVDLKIKLCDAASAGYLILQQFVDRTSDAIAWLAYDIADAPAILDRNGHFDLAERLRLFHAACVAGKINVESYLHRVVDRNFCPGYTPLHFAAHYSLDTFVALAEHISAKDVTPIDIFAMRYGAGGLNKLLENARQLKDVTRFANGDKWSDVISFQGLSLKHLNKAFDRITGDSPIWPRCNLFQIALRLAECPIDYATIDRINCYFIKPTLFMLVDSPVVSCDIFAVECLNRHGAECIYQDAGGTTSSLHLAFRQQNFAIVREIAKVYPHDAPCPVDEQDNLSDLHIFACLGMKLVNLTPANVNLRTKSRVHLTRCEPPLEFAAGSTALHMAIVEGHCMNNVKLLLAHGADPSIKDDNGMTPIHLASFEGSYLTSLLLPHPGSLKENVASNGGLSDFHIACHQSNIEAIKVYLDKLGVDVNHATVEDYARYNTRYLAVEAGYTPLHFAVLGNSVQVVKLLIRRGANVQAKSASGLTPLYLALKLGSYALDCARLFLTLLYEEDPSYVDEMGVTMLHVACACADEAFVEKLVDGGVDVNSRINDGSPILPGCTPLHVVTSDVDESRYDRLMRVESIAKLLLQRGADVTVRDARWRTPLHVARSDDPECINFHMVSLMLKNRSTRTRVDASDATGLSHFHLSVMATKDDDECVKVVEEYLKAGVDVKHATDLFRRQDAGFTALHFVTNYDTVNLVETLVERGGDLLAREQSGSTPLHGLATKLVYEYNSRYSSDKLQKILELNGRTKSATNLLGISPLEALLRSKSKDLIDTDWILAMLSRGARLGVYNPISDENMFGALLNFADVRTGPFVDIWTEALDLSRQVEDADDDTGRSVFHNVVSIECESTQEVVDRYQWAIGELLRQGARLDCKDNDGNTPLHLAAKFSNEAATSVLLDNGADVNLTDNAGHTPLFYRRIKPNRAIIRHLANLLKYELDISDYNRSFDEYMSTASQMMEGCKFCDYELWILGRQFDANDFIRTERGASDYHRTPRWKRDVIEDVNSNLALLHDANQRALFKLQYNKARERMVMMPAAKRVTALLAGAELPDPCSEAIIRNLRNIDLRILVQLDYCDGDDEDKQS